MQHISIFHTLHFILRSSLFHSIYLTNIHQSHEAFDIISEPFSAHNQQLKANTDHKNFTENNDSKQPLQLKCKV